MAEQMKILITGGIELCCVKSNCRWRCTALDAAPIR